MRPKGSESPSLPPSPVLKGELEAPLSFKELWDDPVKLVSLRNRPQTQAKGFVRMVTSTPSFGLSYKYNSLLQVSTLEERRILLVVMPVSH